MNVLLLSQWFAPEPGPQVHELAKGLKDRGHQVTVITGFPSYPTCGFYEGWRPRLYQWDDYCGVPVLRVWHFPHATHSVVRRVLNYVSFSLSAICLAPWLAPKADVMYVFLPPPFLGFAAFVLRLFKRAPFIYDIQDIWPDAAVATGLLKSGVIVRVLRLVERLVYPLATRISVPSPGYADLLQTKKGVAPERICVIPNWEDGERYKPVPSDPSLVDELGLQGKFVVTFAGNVGMAQGLDTLLDAASSLMDHTEIAILVFGDGAALEGLKARCGQEGILNVRFLGRLPQERMPALFAISHLLLVHLRKSEVFARTIPRKTQSYLASGRPLLMAVDGVAAELIRSTDSGVTCPSEDSDAMAGAILDACSMDREALEAKGERGRRLFLDRFEKDVVVDRFEALLKSIACSS